MKHRGLTPILCALCHGVDDPTLAANVTEALRQRVAPREDRGRARRRHHCRGAKKPR